MMLKYVFLVILVMPTGETQVNSANVKICPDIQKVYTGYEEMKSKGLISHWDAQCILFQFKLPEEQT